jgi:hypothetical protein
MIGLVGAVSGLEAAGDVSVLWEGGGSKAGCAGGACEGRHREVCGVEIVWFL